MSGQHPPFRSRPLPSPEDAEIHPGDDVVLIEGDPYYVGNAEEIVDAFRKGTRGVVLRKLWKVLSAKEAKALGTPAEYEIAVRFPTSPKVFHFWACFIKKVRDDDVVKQRIRRQQEEGRG